MGDDESGGDRAGGEWVVNIPPRKLCWFVDNDTMNGKNCKEAINFEKNGNNYSPSTVKRTAEAFLKGVHSGTSTHMILCPSQPATRNPKLWLQAYCRASFDAQGQNQVKMAEMITNNCQALLLRRSEQPITWREALGATFWDPNVGGVPNEAYVKKTPSMITVQGQNRAAITISVFAQAYGLSKDRAGRCGNTELFDRRGDPEKKLEELTNSLGAAEASFHATVCNFLSFKEASTKGRQSHLHGANSRKPGLFAVIQQATPFLRRVFRQGGDDVSSAHVDEVLGNGWERTLYPSDGAATPQGKKDARKIQQKVMEYVKDELLEGGLLAPFKGLAFSTLVYACALKPDADIVKLLLRRLRAEDEDDEEVLDLRGCKRTAIDLTGRTTPPALAQLFGLSARAQSSKGLAEKVLALGAVNSVKTYGAMLGREDIVVAMVKSLATRKHVGTFNSDGSAGEAIEALKNTTGVLRLVHDLVGERDTEMFLGEEGKALGSLQKYAADSWTRCTEKLTAMEKGRLLTSINKQAIKKSLGAAAAEGNEKTKAGSSDDYRQSSQSTLDPGYGYLPHVAVTAADVIFHAEAVWEWHQHEDSPAKEGDLTKGKKARALVSEFVALVVERSVAQFCVDGDEHENQVARALAKFERLVGALDRDGLLFAVLEEDPDALSSPGSPFFDAARLAAVKQAVRAGDTGPADRYRAEEAKPNVRLTLRSEGRADADGKFSFDAQVGDSVLGKLSLLGKDFLKSAMTIGITLLDNGDETGGDEGGCSQTGSSCRSPAPPLSPTTSAEPSGVGSSGKRGLDGANNKSARPSKSARGKAGSRRGKDTLSDPKGHHC